MSCVKSSRFSQKKTFTRFRHPIYLHFGNCIHHPHSFTTSPRHPITRMSFATLAKGLGVTLPLVASSSLAQLATVQSESISESDFCATSHSSSSVCFHNPKGKLAVDHRPSAAECCAACKDNENCKSWTFWNTSDCNLFKDVDGAVEVC